MGLQWVFVDILKWVQKWVKSGFGGGNLKRVKTHSLPMLGPLHDIKNPLGARDCRQSWTIVGGVCRRPFQKARL